MATIRKHRDKFQVQIRRKGFPAISRSFNRMSDAKEWARQMESQADRRGMAGDPRELERITLFDVITRYRDTVTPTKRGHAVEHTFLTAFLRHPICRKRLSDVTTADFIAYRDERLASVSPHTVKRQLGPIRNMFEVARDEWGLPINENPLARLKINLQPNQRERRLVSNEYQRLMIAASDRRCGMVARIMVFAVETAMRRGEILAMRWDHINFERRTLLIPSTKNGHARTIALSVRAMAMLTPHTQPNVFPMTANALRLAWERIRLRCEVEDIHFHDLRHEGISRFFEMSLTVPEAQLMSGHRDMRMLQRYSHAAREQIHQKLASR
ncbi:integrase [Agaricicola taiwanensis]|uniref:Integrase n=1 Tax=Agaricicola taiwanensis TaxID=591372 RepID=A0A8J2YG36_9RHOB|nr:site-specific integrase [Agaricicola taiwanensis]GGE32353.1 integrase [Agaricicola taiwanensis]